MVSKGILLQTLLGWLKSKMSKSPLRSSDLCKKSCPSKKRLQRGPYPCTPHVSAYHVSVSHCCSHALLSKMQWIIAVCRALSFATHYILMLCVCPSPSIAYGFKPLFIVNSTGVCDYLSFPVRD